MSSLIRDLLSRSEFAALTLFLVLCVVFSLTVSGFCQIGNLNVYLQPIPELCIVAIGVAVLMIAGEFDLSIGSVFCLSPMLAVLLMSFADVPMPIAIMSGLIIAGVVGFCNALITLHLKIPSFIATLGTLFMVRSCAVLLAGGFPPVFPREKSVEWLVGRVNLVAVTPRVSLFYMFAIACMAGFILRKTDFGHWIFATGGQRQAARDMGINTRAVKTACFVFCSTLAGMAGIIQSFRVKVIVPNLGTGLELQAIAAAVIGGVALTGGVGSVTGAIVGVLLAALIENVLIISGTNANWFNFAVGGMVIGAVVLNTSVRRFAEASGGYHVK